MDFKRVIRLLTRHFAPLARATLTIIRIRSSLFFFKYERIARTIRVRKHQGPQSEAQPFVAAWAVKNVSRVIPLATCLTQALSLQEMLAKDGYTSTIRVGVKLDDEDEVDAHAWVIFEDHVLIGGNDRNLEDYSVLTDLLPSHE